VDIQPLQSSAYDCRYISLHLGGRYSVAGGKDTLGKDVAESNHIDRVAFGGVNC